jgi:hypothetical protein
MSQVEKLDLLGVTSLGVVAAVLLAGWMVTSHQVAAEADRHAAAQPQAVSLTKEGAMKLTVTAEDTSVAGPMARTRTASVRPTGGPSLEVALPFAFRP